MEEHQSGGEDRWEKKSGDELRHESEDEIQPDGQCMPPPARHVRRRAPCEEMIDAPRIAEGQRGLHVVGSKSVIEEQRPMYEQDQGGDDASERIREARREEK